MIKHFFGKISLRLWKRNDMLDERDIRIAALEKENIELKNELSDLRSRYEQLSENYEKLQHQLNELLRHRFGKKSERFTEESPESNDDNEEDPSEDDSKEEDEWVLYRRRKKNKNKRDIPRRAVIIPVPEDQKQCACGI